MSSTEAGSSGVREASEMKGGRELRGVVITCVCFGLFFVALHM